MYASASHSRAFTTPVKGRRRQLISEEEACKKSVCVCMCVCVVCMCVCVWCVCEKWGGGTPILPPMVMDLFAENHRAGNVSTPILPERNVIANHFLMKPLKFCCIWSEDGSGVAHDNLRLHGNKVQPILK